jgi:hypothetical protein
MVLRMPVSIRSAAMVVARLRRFMVDMEYQNGRYVNR